MIATIGLKVATPADAPIVAIRVNNIGKIAFICPTMLLIDFEELFTIDITIPISNATTVKKHIRFIKSLVDLSLVLLLKPFNIFETTPTLIKMDKVGRSIYN